MTEQQRLLTRIRQLEDENKLIWRTNRAISEAMKHYDFHFQQLDLADTLARWREKHKLLRPSAPQNN